MSADYLAPWCSDPARVLPLDGEWAFSLAGHSGPIRVPGTWEAQGYPRREEGPAIYERSIPVPLAWQGLHVQLQFDAVSYHIEAEVNGVTVGAHSGAWSPFAFDVTDALRPGGENTLRLTVYKTGERFAMRESLAGFLPDVMLMFGGVWQSARLVAYDGPALSDLAVLADVSGEVRVSAALHHADGLAASVRLLDPAGLVVGEATCTIDAGRISAALQVIDPQLWSPAQPARYKVQVRVGTGDAAQIVAAQRFGFRALTHAGEQLLFNGQPVMLRGALNWGWYPDLLCPAPDEAAIREEFRRLRALGFNLVKLCLYVPSPLYFAIADEEGMFLWLELPMWLPQVTPRLRQQAPAEYADITAAVQSHPSIIIYSLGCELNRAVDAELLAQLDGIVRGGTGGALYCDNSGSGEAYGGLSFDFADFNDYHFYADLQYFDPLCDHFRRDWRPPRPWIFGEFCDADDFRDLDEIAAAHGGALPWWLAEWNPLHSREFIGYPGQRERLAGQDLGFTHQDIQRISRQQSFVLRKVILEKVRARAGMGGYVVTSIRDTPLATSSLFDDLGRNKYPPEAFHQFNADSVLLLGRGRARRWTRGGDRPYPAEPFCFVAGQGISLDVILSHAGAPLPGGNLTWRISGSQGDAVAEGAAHVAGPLAGGAPQAVGRAIFTAPPVTGATTLRLDVALHSGQMDISNRWSLWVFPAVASWPDGLGLYDPAGVLHTLDDLYSSARQVDAPFRAVTVLITSTIDAPVQEFLLGGGHVLLLQQGDRPLPAWSGPFWREGIKLIYDHPVMNAFPHAGYADAQFYGLATDWALDSARLAEVLPEIRSVRPLLRRLDARHFFVRDYLLEAEVGAGRLVASTLRFGGGLGDQPAGLQANLAGRWLLLQLIKALQRRLA